MSGIIIYKSKYGSTKKYAEWLKEATGFEMAEAGKIKIGEVAKYDTIIYGGGIFAGGITGISFLKKNIEKLKGKKIVAFCCGAFPFDADLIKELKERNLSGELSDIPLYYCRGAFDLANMHFTDKTLCKMLIKSIEKKAPGERDERDEGFLELARTSCDWTDKSYIGPILEECKTA